MPPLSNKFRLIHPFHIGDGNDFAEVKLFVEITSGGIHIGDMLWIQGASFYTSWIEEVKDEEYIESYTVVTAKLLSNNPQDRFKLDPNNLAEGCVIGTAMHKEKS